MVGKPIAKFCLVLAAMVKPITGGVGARDGG